MPSCARLTPETQKTLNCNSTSVRHAWYTEWLPAVGVEAVRLVLKNKSVVGNFRAKVSIQTAGVRTDNPDAPDDTQGSGYLTGAGEQYELLDLSTVTPSKFFIRFGLAYSATDTTYSEADAAMQISFGTKGGAVRGSVSKHLVAATTTSRYLEVTPWMPALEVTKYRGAYVITKADANFQSRLAYQTASTSIQSPESWASTDSFQSGNLEECSGELTPTITGKMWIRFGLEYSCASGSDQGADVSVAIATKG